MDEADEPKRGLSAWSPRRGLRGSNPGRDLRNSNPGRDLRAERIGEILQPGDAAKQANRETRVRRSFFATLKRAMRAIPFGEDVVASYYCALDPRTPAGTRGVLLAALAYFVLPIDIVPDIIAGLGFTDDAAVLLAAFTAVQRDIRPRHYAKARDALGARRPAAATPPEAEPDAG